MNDRRVASPAAIVTSAGMAKIQNPARSLSTIVSKKAHMASGATTSAQTKNATRTRVLRMTALSTSTSSRRVSVTTVDREDQDDRDGNGNNRKNPRRYRVCDNRDDATPSQKRDRSGDETDTNR